MGLGGWQSSTGLPGSAWPTVALNRAAVLCAFSLPFGDGRDIIPRNKNQPPVLYWWLILDHYSC